MALLLSIVGAVVLGLLAVVWAIIWITVRNLL